ncbi:MAG: beta strand repeat-containing protein [Ilumatobacter sp.]|uniref:beta strand repeat-containing protein n=1 Tax=Ilumatobacter sp. TaxID=1967498 RepID=UPI0039193936
MNRLLLAAGLLAVTAVITTVSSTPAAAATRTVTTTNDVTDGGDGLLSLREAVAASNFDDVVIVPAGTYTLDCPTPGTPAPENGNAWGDLDITRAITISGSTTGTTTITIDPACGERVIDLLQGSGQSVLLEHLTITGGREAASSSIGRGGGIRSGSTGFTIDDVVVTDNHAGPNAEGGGISSQGPVVIRNGSRITDNLAGDATGTSAGGDGGGIAMVTATADLSITASTVSGNVSGDGSGGTSAAGDGGGIYIDARADLTVVDTVITRNGLGDAANGAVGGGAAGGGIASRAFTADSGVAVISGSTISDNVGGNGFVNGFFGGGGGMWLNHRDVTISNSDIVDNETAPAGNGDQGGHGGGVAITPAFGSPAPLDVSLLGNTISGNEIGPAGTGTSATGPVGGSGGGVYVAAVTGTVEFVGNTFDANTAGDNGAGLTTGGNPGSGGNLYVQLAGTSEDVAPGEIALTGGAIRNGRTGAGVESFNAAFGGGAFLTAGTQQGGGTIVVDGTQITGNRTITSNDGGVGGGIYANSFVANGQLPVPPAGSITIQNVTASSNSTADGAFSADSGNGGNGGALHLSASGASTGPTVSIIDSVVSGNSAGFGSEGATIGGAGGAGGGVYVNAADVVVRGSTISGNTAGDGATGGTSGGQGGAGGGLAVSGAALTIDQSTITDNTAGSGGTGSGSIGGGGGNGGGLSLTSGAEVVISDSEVTANSSGFGGAGATTGGRGGAGGGLFIDVTTTGADVSISTTDVSDNTAGTGNSGADGDGGPGGPGGGAFVSVDQADIDIVASTIERNVAGSGGAATQTVGDGERGGAGGSGGGVYAEDGSAVPTGTFTITGSSVADNNAGNAGTSANDRAGFAGVGGGLDVRFGSIVTPDLPNPGSGRIVISRTSVVDNRAGAGALGDGATRDSDGGAGGGVYLRAGGNSPGDVRVERSTIHANRGGAAVGDTREGDGGGLFIVAPTRSATITQSTITANDGLNGVNILTRAVTNTFLGNVVGDAPNSQSENCNAIGVTTISNGFNLEATANGNGHTCQFTDDDDLTTDSTDLGALADNGGVGLTRIPLLAGALVDVIPCSATTDQRGVAAPVGDTCDIGAVELDSEGVRVSDATVAESEGSVDVRVTRTGDAGALAVEVTTVEGTARAGFDFVETTEVVTWQAGDTSPKFVTIPIIVDDFAEDDETFTVSAAGATATVTIVDTVDLIVPTDPARFVDTRATGSTIDTRFEADGKRAGGTEYLVDIAGRGDVPADAVGAVMNVTAVAPEGVGFVTVHPCLAQRPTASSLNYTQSVNLGNEIIAGLDAQGQTCFFTSAAVHLTVDVVGYVPRGSDLTSVSPARVLDTRQQFGGDGPTTAGSTTTLKIEGQADVPTSADAVVINLTAVRPQTNGFVTVFPCGPTVPTAASLNYTANVSRGNELIAQLSDDGEVCIFTSGSTNLTVDVVGHIPAGTSLTPVTPARLLDTRDPGIGKRPEGTQFTLDVAGRAGVAEGATAVIVNVTAVQPERNGFVTVHPCLATPPVASSLNHVTAVNGGNEIVARLSAEGEICLFNSGRTHLTVDVVAFLS